MIKVIHASLISRAVNEEVPKPAYKADGFCAEIEDCKIDSYKCARSLNHKIIRFNIKFKCTY
jgi:hypothetical protein